MAHQPYLENMLTCTFLEPAGLSDNYLSNSWPMANRTANWHPVSSTVVNWISPHTQDVTYCFNNFGYRDVNWDESTIQNSIWCFGDSQTVGVGVPGEQTWPSMLQRLTGIPTINIGIAGASNDTISRLIVSCLNLYKPRAICCLLTAPNRREIINNQYSCTVFPQFLKIINNSDVDLFDQYLTQVDETADSINRDKNILLIQSVCKNKNTPLSLVDFNQNPGTLCQTDLAYDNMHIGPKLHNSIAEYFKINLKLS
jgi:hypothetical protein